MYAFLPVLIFRFFFMANVIANVMADRIRTGDPRGFNKGRSLKFREGSWFDKNLKKAGGHIERNVVEITMKMKTIVWKPLLIKITKIRLRNLDK